MQKLLLVLFLITYVLSDESIRFAAVLYRHGDRTPVAPYPSDPWRNESLWPVKFGQLTNIGKEQHFKLGRWLRKRYSHLLSSQFDPTEIHVRSTDVDRTLMSALANLAGMYPPVNNSIWNPELLWQPIPVHTTPANDDKVLAMRKPCKAYDQELKRYTQSNKYKDELSKYQDLMDYLTAYTGQKIKDFDGIVNLYSTLEIERLYNFTLPNWTNSVFPDKLIKPAGYSFSVSTATPTLARLAVGPFLQEVTKLMSKSIEVNSTQKPLNVAIYSGHDITVASVLNALGMFDDRCPCYTSTVIIELIYVNTTSSHYVRISYRNTTEIVEPNVLKIPYCGKLCPLERFLKLYKHMIEFDWEHECDNRTLSNLAVILFVAIAISACVSVPHCIILLRRLRKRLRSDVPYTNITSMEAIPPLNLPNNKDAKLYFK